jgi:hypothetical protein
MSPGRRQSKRGQTMVELALVLPLFLSVLLGIIVLGIGVFYQQEITNAAREAARFASVHSATAQCPTVSRLNPGPPSITYPATDPLTGRQAADTSRPLSYVRCDRPEDGWPNMIAQARSRVFGLNPSAVRIAACWSGYVSVAPAPGNYDAPPDATHPWAGCTIGGHDPTVAPDQIGCGASLVASTIDTASNASEKMGVKVANRVTAYACFVWTPPMAGFLLIPQHVTLRGVITEPIERQQ